MDALTVTIPPLVARRKVAGLSQDEIARRLGVDRSHYSRMERGFAPLSGNAAQVLAKLFCVAQAVIAQEYETTAPAKSAARNLPLFEEGGS